MNESELLQIILPAFHADKTVAVGVGDDCALLQFGNKYLLAAADQVIGNIHYVPDTPPEAVAAKLLKRNLSDIAAMGGIARYALCTLAVAGRCDEWLQRFFKGLEECAEFYQISIVGGDLANLPVNGECAALTILGEVEPDKVCLRKNARPGDAIMVTGELGDTFFSGHHLDFVPRLGEGRFLAENGFSCCMMDISDGLAADLPKLLAASQVNCDIYLDRLPCRNHCPAINALSDGEDYELLFTLPQEKVELLQQKWHFDTPLTQIGRISDGDGRISYWDAGKIIQLNGVTGYEHFGN